jgi:single-strand DNA-binding protein
MALSQLWKVELLMNKTMQTGRLTKDPELKLIAGSGTSTCTVTIAVDRKFKKEGQPDVDFIPCVFWGKTAEALVNYQKKGNKIAVEGRIATRNYDKDGTKIYVTEIIVEELEFLDKKDSATSSGNNSSGNNTPNYMDDVTPVDDGDIPF